MRVGLDTNVLVYAEGVNDAARKETIVRLLRRLPPENVHLPVQAVAELFHIFVTKAAVFPPLSKDTARRLCAPQSLADHTRGNPLQVTDGATPHPLRLYDAIFTSGAAFPRRS